MSTPLSPAAQAVLNSMYRSYDHEPTRRLIAAAVFRAVADQVVPEPPDCGSALHDYNKGAEDRQRLIRYRLLAIAAELEGADA